MTIANKTFQVGKWYKFISPYLSLSLKEDLNDDNQFVIGNKKPAKENSIFLLLGYGRSKNRLKYYSEFYIKILYEDKIYYFHYVTDSLFHENPENYILCLT